MNETKLPSGQTLKWKSQEFPSVYANLMGFGLSAFDISILLGQIGESTPEEVVGIPQLKVILSPEQAANLIRLLTVAVATYVKNNGPLRTSGEVNVEDVMKQVLELGGKGNEVEG